MFLPVCCYMIGSFATLTILMKNSLMENLGQDYVRTAYAKGLSEKRVIFLHALRNSLIPISTGLGHFFSLIEAGPRRGPSVSIFRRRLHKFRRTRRGYYSFVFLIAAYAVSFLLPVLVNNK